MPFEDTPGERRREVTAQELGALLSGIDLVAVDPKHLPDDPQVLQQMVLDLMAELGSRVHRTKQDRGPVARVVGRQAQPQERTALRRSTGAFCGRLAGAASGTGNASEAGWLR